MSYKTKLKLAETMKTLMEKNTLERISVTEIVKKSGVSRQTFYRNFEDKYQMVNWYFDILAMQSFKEMNDSNGLEDALISKFNYIKKEKVFFVEAFQNTDNNSVVHHDYEFILEFYTKKIEHTYPDKVPSDIEFLLEFYCHASISVTVDWVVGGMKRSPEDMAHLLICALPPKLEEALEYIL